MANYTLLKEVIALVEEFESGKAAHAYLSNADGFKQWIFDTSKAKDAVIVEPEWEGKEKGRSAESVINTLIVHMNRYARTYAKSAIQGSAFSTQEEFIYLINLKAFGEMTKMALIKKNLQDKPTGMQIIHRLVQQGWIKQQDSALDRRSKVISLTPAGLKVLEKQMHKIRKATTIVTGDLSHVEKMQLIHLLHKLDTFHHPIYNRQLESADLVDRVFEEMRPSNS